MSSVNYLFDLHKTMQKHCVACALNTSALSRRHKLYLRRGTYGLGVLFTAWSNFLQSSVYYFIMWYTFNQSMNRNIWMTRKLTLTLLDCTKSYKNYLQNTQHVVLRNRPTLSIGTERLACLNNPMACSWGPLPSTRQVPGSSPGPGRRAAGIFFLHPPFLPPSGESFFRTFPTQPMVRLGLM